MFSPVECVTVEATARNAFLLAYRALTYELHQKRKSVGASGIVSALDAGRPLNHQAFVQQLAADYSHGIAIAETELTDHWSRLKTEFARDDMSGFTSVFFSFDQNLPFVSSFYVPPYEDMRDGKIQGWLDKDLDYIAFSSVGRDDCSTLALSWRKGSKVGKIAEQLEAVEPELAATLAFRFALANSENVFVSPDWYEGLGDKEKADLAALFAHNVPGSPPAKIQVKAGCRLINATLARTVRVG